MDQNGDTLDSFSLTSFTRCDSFQNAPSGSADHPLADYYNMNHYRRGHAIIFSHIQFDGDLAKREGASKDAKDLEEVLAALKFNVKVYTDLKYGAIYEVITTCKYTSPMVSDDVVVFVVSQSDHLDVDCLLVAVLSHGDRGKVYARDHHYPPDFLWKSFSGDKCPSLAGKPKLFFVQACRGDETDDGSRVRMATQVDSQASYTIPVMADILVMYSCYDGYVSWRSTRTGSWFIQSLCEELKTRSKSTDLLTILTFLNRRMAITYKSVAPSKKEMHGKKQIGTIVSTLTRLLYFYPVE
uniref:Caspase family p20 domain-containing protein n=2 Tax=Photinus pyralis TaxID=7054 RepID=A0A1Y1M8U1_PHOPY